jgi:hypothetical protein
MSLGRINGPMLQPNLERQGVNIALDGNLTYWDVNNRYVGINTTTPNYTLDVNGNVHIGNIYVKGNTITLDSGYKLNLGSISNITISGGSANSIMYTDGLGNVAFGNLTTLVSLEGFTGTGVTLGTPTQGSLSNAVSLGSQYTVTDAIALINQNLGNVTANVSTLAAAKYSNANAASYLTVYGGNIAANVVTANLFSGNISGTITGNINGTNATFSNISGNIITSSQPYITSVGTLSTLTVGGNATVGNIVTTGSLYGNVIADTITPYLTGVVTFTNNTAVKLPSGSSTTRPSGVAGYFRYNTDIATLEYFNGSSWIPFTNQIIDQQISPDGVSTSFTLSQTATATGLIVSINGTMQRPGSAYTVVGTTITFAETPSVTDIIDVRFIGSPGTTTLDYSIVDTGNVTVGTSNVIVDSFSSTLYRSAQYVISSANGTDASMLTISLIQNGSVALVSTIGNVNTGSSYLTFYANTSAGTVNLLAKGTVASNQLRIQRTYFNV